MEQNFFTFILDFIKLLQDPNIENHIKEKAIKSLLKQSVDNQQNYGYQTKQDLEQDSIDFSNAEIIDGNRLRLVYGSIDLNLVGYLYFK